MRALELKEKLRKTKPFSTNELLRALNPARGTRLNIKGMIAQCMTQMKKVLNPIKFRCIPLN